MVVQIQRISPHSRSAPNGGAIKKSPKFLGQIYAISPKFVGQIYAIVSKFSTDFAFLDNYFAFYHINKTHAGGTIKNHLNNIYRSHLSIFSLFWDNVLPSADNISQGGSHHSHN